MEDNDGNRYHTDAEKWRVMENTWKDIFRITEEDEAPFATLQSEHRDTYVNIQNTRIQPYDKTEVTRPDKGCFYTRPRDKDEIKRHIRKSKNKAPGSSRINKTILKNCTNKTLSMLRNPSTPVYY